MENGVYVFGIADKPMQTEVTDLNEKGFLGGDIAQFRDYVERRYAAFFDLCYVLNELAQAVKFELQVNNQDGQQVLAATVFVRLLNGFQSTVILVRTGLIVDAMVVLRAAMESIFILKLLCEERDFLVEYIKSDKAEQLTLLNVAAQSQNVNLAEVRTYATSEVLARLKQEVADENCKRLNIEDVARRAGVHHLYDTDYRILCQPTHTSPRAIEKFVSTDKIGDVSGFNWGPTEDGIEYVLTTAAQVLHIALVSVTKLFALFEARRARLVELDATWSRLVSPPSP